jgi:hypothetical protein
VLAVAVILLAAKPFAMVFSVAVEMLNLRMRSKRVAPVRLRKRIYRRAADT